ncbi:MAG: phosphoadenylyl-sulfate reductase [Kiritimatiellaeota bacterium]|nr:phosphoadenylyl-sulfate reductase [Kiritimatiellota bacterium]
MTESFVKENWSSLEGIPAEDVLRWASENFGDRLVFATSLGLEDQVLMDMMARLGIDVDVFTLDTGRLFDETYNLIEATEKRYARKIRLFFPNASEVERMIEENGINLFLKSAEMRRRCCSVRKLEPLRRALNGYDAWICGLRKEQSDSRSNSRTLLWDSNVQMVKINPLVDWSSREVLEYVKKNDVPYNKLHDEGFPSVGCACCTRAVNPGEDMRAGRWWWENESRKECGLHMVDGKLARKSAASTR